MVNQNKPQNKVSFGTNFSNRFEKFVENNFEKFNVEDFANIKLLKKDGKFRELDIDEDFELVGWERTGLDDDMPVYGPKYYELCLSRKVSEKSISKKIIYKKDDHKTNLLEAFIQELKTFLNVEKIDEIDKEIVKAKEAADKEAEAALLKQQQIEANEQLNQKIKMDTLKDAFGTKISIKKQ